MASSLPTHFHPITTATSSSSSSNRTNRIKPAGSSSSNKWWTPIFGVPSDPDYIHTPVTVTETSDPDNGRSNARFAPGCFTEEKAKQLRMKTVESSNFHDVMYHSAIATRLASDITGRNGR